MDEGSEGMDDRERGSESSSLSTATDSGNASGSTSRALLTLAAPSCCLNETLRTSFKGFVNSFLGITNDGGGPVTIGEGGCIFSAELTLIRGRLLVLWRFRGLRASMVPSCRFRRMGSEREIRSVGG